MSHPDNDALTWAGDDEPTPTRPPRKPAKTSPATEASIGEPPVEGEALEAVSTEAEPPTLSDVDAPVSVEAPEEETDPQLPEGWTALGPGSDRVQKVPLDAATPEPAPLGNVALISVGIVAGINLLWTVGWFLGAQRLADWITITTGAVADVMFQASMWLAVAAPLLWFGATWLLTRRSKPWVRFAGWALGIVLLVPWPFVMVGVWGQ